MSARTPPTATPGLRRRVIVELTPAELPLLEAAERAHGSKRAAVVAALRALAQAEGGAQEGARVARRGRRAGAAGAAEGDGEPEQGRAALRAKGERVKEALARSETTGRQAAARAQAERERDDAQAALAAARAQLAEQQTQAEGEYQDLADEIRGLEARLPRALYCARCERWAPEREWAWVDEEGEGGGAERAYHRPCGDHGPAFLGASSWLGRRARREDAGP